MCGTSFQISSDIFRGWNRKSNLVFGKLVSSLMGLEFAISFNETLTICLNCTMERRIQNPVKHLRCAKIVLTGFSH